MKKHMFKRLLVCVLSAGMVMSLGGVSALAAETDDGEIQPLDATGGSEAFAVYSAEDTSLSFYMDDTVPTEGSTYNGKTVTEVYADVDSIKATSVDDIPWYGNCDDTTEVVVDPSFKNAAPVSLACWFDNFENCTVFEGMENLDTSRVTDMRAMFFSCGSMTELDMSGWNTANVKDMGSMFSYCESLTELDVSGLDTSNVRSFSLMFYRCTGLTELDVSGFDISSASTLFGLFGGCSALTALDVSGWDTANVTSMYELFRSCSALTELDLSGWDTTKVDSCIDFATNCYSLEHVKLGEKTDIFTKGQLVDQQDWYEEPELETVTSSDYLQDASYPGEYWTYVDHAYDFTNITWTWSSDYDSATATVKCSDCGKEYTVDADITYTEYTPEPPYFSGAIVYTATADFSDIGGGIYTDTKTYSMKTAGIVDVFAIYSEDDTSLSFYTDDTVPTAGSTYNGKTVTEVYEDLDSLDVTGTDGAPWYSIRRSITSVVIDPSFMNAKPKSLAYWFGYLINCKSIEGLENIDTSNVTNMEWMFWNCRSLTELDVSSFDTSNVTDMSDMFASCSGLTEIDVSGFDTSNVTDMSEMFTNCSGLTEIDVSGFDTSKVTDMDFMFSSCPGLTSIDLSGFDTSNVTAMGHVFKFDTNLTDVNLSGFDTSNATYISAMFLGCSSLTTLDLSGWDTSNMTAMEGTFEDCASLTSLDISGWDTSSVTDMRGLFDGCSSLTTLDVSGFNTSNVKVMYSMFHNCSSLKSLNVSGWDTSKVTHMTYMFANCSSLTTLDLSSWDTSSVLSDPRSDFTNGCSDFATGCTSLQRVILGKKTDIFTKGKLLDQKTWYKDSPTSGIVASSNYLQDASYPGEYWSYSTAAKVNGLHKDSDKKWRYYVDGVFTKYTGFATNSNGKWYVENGYVNFDKNSVYKDTTGAIGSKGTWYYVLGNKVQEKFTGLANYKNANGWWYIKNGKVDFTHNGVDKNKNGWYYVVGGKVQFGFTGLANYKNANGWWYISGGKVNFNHNGVDKNKNGWWYVEGGKVNFNYTNRVSNYKNANGWWYIKNGKVDFTYNGWARNKNGWWRVVNGKVRF